MMTIGLGVRLLNQNLGVAFIIDSCCHDNDGKLSLT